MNFSPAVAMTLQCFVHPQGLFRRNVHVKLSVDTEHGLPDAIRVAECLDCFVKLAMFVRLTAEPLAQQGVPAWRVTSDTAHLLPQIRRQAERDDPFYRGLERHSPQ